MAKWSARDVAAEHEDELTPFVFEGMDGREYELPNMLTVPGHLARRLANGDETVLEELAPDAYKAILEMPGYVAQRLDEAWAAHSGETGKSVLPSSPTTNDGQPSKQTSRPAASKPRKRR